VLRNAHKIGPDLRPNSDLGRGLHWVMLHTLASHQTWFGTMYFSKGCNRTLHRRSTTLTPWEKEKMKFFLSKIYFLTPKACLLSRGSIALLSLSGHNPSRGRRRKLIVSFYNYHGPKAVLALEWAVQPTFSLSDHKPSSFGRRRKLPELYNHGQRRACSPAGCNHLSLSGHNPPLEEEKKLLFLFSVPPSL